MQSFVRATVLTNIGGRGAYISDPGRQEEIVISSAPMDWKPYHDFEQSRPQKGAKIVEGRELIIDIPNEWYTSIRHKVNFNQIDGTLQNELRRRCQQLVETAVGKKTDLQWAVHWNKARTNLHIHVVFSERTREDKGTWDRDIYLTSDGKVARRAADRARDPGGNVLPPIHRKGDLKGDFSAKNDDYSKKWWLAAAKQNVENVLKEYGVTIDERGLVSQYHEGKGSDASKIRRKNEAIRATNTNYKAFIEKNPDVAKKHVGKAHREAVAAAKAGKVVDFKKTTFGGVKILTFTLKEWEKRQKGKALNEREDMPPEGSKTAQIGAKVPKVDKKATQAPKKPSKAEIRAEKARAAEAARQAAAAAARAERAAREEVAAIVEYRWATAEELRFTGWKTLDGERALDAMRSNLSSFPIIYRDDYGFRIRTFDGTDWQNAKTFADQTEPTFRHWRERLGGTSTFEDYRSKIAADRAKNVDARQPGKEHQQTQTKQKDISD